MSDAPPPYPEVMALTCRAYEASGCGSIEEFAKMLGGVGVRSLWRWKRGEGPLIPIVAMVLDEIAEGWKPRRWTK